MHGAARRGHIEVMRVLLQAGARLDEQDKVRVTPPKTPLLHLILSIV